jgi:hypothetical protein
LQKTAKAASLVIRLWHDPPVFCVCVGGFAVGGHMHAV